MHQFIVRFFVPLLFVFLHANCASRETAINNDNKNISSPNIQNSSGIPPEKNLETNAALTNKIQSYMLPQIVGNIKNSEFLIWDYDFLNKQSQEILRRKKNVKSPLEKSIVKDLDGRLNLLNVFSVFDLTSGKFIQMKLNSELKISSGQGGDCSPQYNQTHIAATAINVDKELSIKMDSLQGILIPKNFEIRLASQIERSEVKNFLKKKYQGNTISREQIDNNNSVFLLQFGNQKQLITLNLEPSDEVSYIVLQKNNNSLHEIRPIEFRGCGS